MAPTAKFRVLLNFFRTERAGFHGKPPRELLQRVPPEPDKVNSVTSRPTTHFLLLFFVGYSYMGTMSLLQTPLRRLWNVLPALLRPRAVEHAT
ncbi:MAG: hypothetical protein ABSA70_12725 [Terriglobia bacterium]